MKRSLHFKETKIKGVKKQYNTFQGATRKLKKKNANRTGQRKKNDSPEKGVGNGYFDENNVSNIYPVLRIAISV